MGKELIILFIIGYVAYSFFPIATLIVGFVIVALILWGALKIHNEEVKKEQEEATAKRNEEIEKAAKEAEKQRAEELALELARKAEENRAKEKEAVRKRLDEEHEIVINHNEEMRIAQRQYIFEKCQQYIPVLARKRLRLITYDDYGDPCYKAWFDEIINFYSKKIIHIPAYLHFKRSPYENGNYSLIISEKEITKLIDSIALEAQKELIPDDSIVDDMNGIDFEHYCSEKLKAAGWKTTVSSASGDQGADIIAEYNDIRVAIQCKRFSKPVGNKAVQEVAAARNYYGSDFAVVVTNNTFTKSAKQLANTNDVHLIHYSELGELASLLEIA